jgi:hypothetical protein
MIALGWGLIGAILLSFGCLIAAIRSLISLREAYNSESRLLAITGFIAGIIASAFFAWVTIKLIDYLDATATTLFGQ